MTQLPSADDFAAIGRGYDAACGRSLSLHADAYNRPEWFNADLRAVLAKHWQWVCHAEKLHAPGSYLAVQIAGQPIAVVRDRGGVLRAFYNLCKHRAHELLSGEGTTSRIMCPYHAWIYKLDGQLVRAPETEHLEDFTPSEICRDAVQVAKFCGFVYVNLDPEAPSLSSQTGSLETEIRHWAPDRDPMEVDAMRYIDEVLQPEGHRPGQVGAARHGDAGLHPRAECERSHRIGEVRTRGASFPRSGAGRLRTRRGGRCMKLHGKTALVTGGCGGIGRAVTLRLMNDGYTVLGCGRGPRPGDFPGDAAWVQASVAAPARAQQIVAAAQALGPVSLLVNNAGVQVEKTTADSLDADWDLVIGANCRGVFNMCRAVLPDMGRSGGVIVNIGSISATAADPSMALYNASKAFVHGLTRSIAVDHGPKVRCNAIAPGWIMTGMAEDALALANDPGAARRDALARHPVGRMGTPEDIANMVSWLASDQAAYVSGASFTVDGGMTAASPLNPGLF